MNGGILDATLVEAILHATRPLDELDLERLVARFPLPGVRSAVPVLPDGQRGADTLRPAEPAGHVLEPLDRTSHAQVLARLAGSESAGGPPIVVDPVGVRIGETLMPLVVPRPIIREAVLWTRPDTDGLIEGLRKTLSTVDPAVRIRIRDPHGIITAETLPRLFGTVAPERLTLWVEDAHRCAFAVARAASACARPPLVRTTILGVGPRSGAAPTELLVDQHLHDAALDLCAATGHRIPDHHPYWGPRMREATEPELIAWSASAPEAHYGRVRGTARGAVLKARLAPGTLRAFIREFLQEWGAPDDPAVEQRLVEAVAARIRPGERPDGPTLYTIAATVLDLRALAGSAHDDTGEAR